MENKAAGAPASSGIGGMDNVIPQVPSWFIFVRYAQIVLTLVVFICCCVSVSQVGSYWFGWGGGFGIFTCIYTFIFLAGVLLVPIYATNFYFKWFCLGAEAFAVFWWLITFAGLASWATVLKPVDVLSDYYDDSGLKTSYGATAAGAAFGAFNWIAFCVTLAFYAIGCHKARITKRGWAGGVEAGNTSMGPIGVQQPAPQVYDPAPEPAGYGYGQQQQYPSVPTPAPQQTYHQ
ncbi:hypothetical protein ABW19_dt0208409 [Dactylella cylindrospora]|nr:hypothetical protein ABW19_dt0208409 [Dactylella cylindrospora]